MKTWLSPLVALSDADYSNRIVIRRPCSYFSEDGSENSLFVVLRWKSLECDNLAVGCY